MTIAVYERAHSAHAWQYKLSAPKQLAEMERDINDSFGTETLLVPVPDGQYPKKYLDAHFDLEYHC